MLQALSRETVQRVIDLARDRNAGNRQALFDLLTVMSPDERAELMALLWIGRGDEPTSSWAATVQYARDHSDKGDVAYIMTKGPLPDYLAKGLEALGL